MVKRRGIGFVNMNVLLDLLDPNDTAVSSLLTALRDVRLYGSVGYPSSMQIVDTQLLASEA